MLRKSFELERKEWIGLLQLGLADCRLREEIREDKREESDNGNGDEQVRRCL